MIDPSHIGKKLPVFTAIAEVGQLRFFAKATGETRPLYTDEAAARAAGHPGLPLPPTFLFSLELQQQDPAWRDEMGIEVARILHGEQSFTYHRLGYAGDTFSFASEIEDIYDKKNGALSFVVRKTRVSNQHGEHVADLRNTLVHRNR